MTSASTKAAALLLAVTLPFAGSAPAAPEPARSVLPRPPQRVLFVGNSLTQYNGGLNEHVRRLQQAGDSWNAPYFEDAALAKPGAYLREHAAPLQETLRRGLPWDAVVLQGYSDEPASTDPAVVERFEAAVRALDAVVRESRSRSVLFMTWGYRGEPAMAARLDAGYRRVGDALRVPVVPVGLAFERARRERPDVALVVEDGKHPTMAGTYLAACVFYSSFEGHTPEGNRYIATLDAKVARVLQSIAWRTASEFHGW